MAATEIRQPQLTHWVALTLPHWLTGWGGIGWLIGERKRNGRNMGLCETMCGLLHRQSDVQQSVFKGCLGCQLTTIFDLGNSQNTYDEWYAGEGMVLQSGLL